MITDFWEHLNTIDWNTDTIKVSLHTSRPALTRISPDDETRLFLVHSDGEMHECQSIPASDPHQWAVPDRPATFTCWELRDVYGHSIAKGRFDPPEVTA